MGLQLWRRARRGRGADEGAARRQGRQPRRDEHLGLPVPPGFTITTEVCTHFYDNGRTYPGRLKDQVGEALADIEQRARRQLRRPGGSAAGLGPLRRARFDAGHDGHRPQPRPQRRDGGGPGRRQRRPALRLGQLSPLHPDVRRRRARPRPPPVRGSARERQAGQAAPCSTPSSTRDDWQSWSPPTRQIVEEGHRPALPAGPAGAALGRDRRGVRLLDDAARRSPTAGCTTSRRRWGTAVNVQAMVFGNMGEDCATGVAFTRNPSTGEKRVLRRIPGQRPGRGRRRRHPHAAAPDQRRPAGSGVDRPVDGRGDAGGLRRARRRCASSSKRHYRDMQDIEFTVERGKLWMLQTRTGKRTARRR